MAALARLIGLLALVCVACDDGGGAPAAPDAAQDMALEADASLDLDAAARDAAPMPVIDAQIIDAVPVDAPPCAPQATLETDAIAWRWWDPASAPSASVAVELIDADCTALRARTDVDWLDVALDPAGRLLLRATGPGTSGLHAAQVWIEDPGAGEALAMVALSLQRLTRPADGRPKVLVIGADGVRSDALRFAETSELDFWAQHGAYTGAARTQLTAPTVSGPGWTSILTGVEPANHGVQGNGDFDERDPRWPTFLARARALGFGTAASCQWLPILANLLEADAVDWRGTGNQTVVTALAADQLRMADHDVLFVHMDDPDHAGHADGFAVSVPTYVDAIERVDADTASLVDAIFERPTIADEDWLFVFTTDHGGRGTNHGPQDAENQTIPFIIAGPAAAPDRLGADASHMAVHATVMTHLGVPPSPDWALDAPAVGLAAEGACFDAIDNDGDGAVDCADSDCRCPCGGDCPGEERPPPECPTRNVGMALGLAAIEGDTSDAERRMFDCGGLGPEQSFQWVAPAADSYTFNTIGSAFDTVLALRTQCVQPSQNCNADLYPSRRGDVPLSTESRVFADLEEGDRVFIVVDGEGDAASGEFVVNIHSQRAECGDADLESAVGVAIAEGTNDAAPTRYPDACATAARDHTLRWTAPAAGTFRFDTLGSDFDTVLWILAPDCSGAARVCNDDADGLQSSLEIELAEGEEIIVVIGGFRGRAGAWRLNVAAVDAQ